MPANKTCAVFTSLLFLWIAWCGGDNATTATSVRGRCECVHKIDSMSLKRIAAIDVQQKNALCSETEIILTLEQNRAACLNPASQQGLKLQECWRSHENNLLKTKVCIRRKMTSH